MLTLDHLVLLVSDLDQAVARYTALGFAVTPGGTHADGLTHNALIVFGDGTYVELIAFLDPADPHDNVWGWRHYVAFGGGLIDYCLASNDLAADTTQLRMHGLSVSAPTDGGRQRPDGVALRWRSARFDQIGRVLPFLIEDVTPRALRVPIDCIEHANGATGISELTLATNDLAEAATAFAKLSQERSSSVIGDDRLEGEMTSFWVGTHKLTLVAPTSDYSPIAKHLETIGAGPFEVMLSSGHAAQVQLLDMDLTQGVRIRL